MSEPYPEEHFPPNEFVEIDGLLYPHPLWLDAINTAGIQLIAERVRGSAREAGRALVGCLTEAAAEEVRRRAAELLSTHHKGLRPDDAPPGYRVVGVIPSC